MQFYVPFTVLSNSGSPPPHIDQITPTTVQVGINNTFTITGSGFQSGFSGMLWVGSNSFPLKPGAQTMYTSPSQAQLVAQVGATTDPTTTFGLQIINPDGQGSNIYTGLTAQPTTGANGNGNLQVSFSPNPVSSSADGAWYYTVLVKETSGNAVTMVGLTIGGRDYSTSISQWFGTNTVPPNGQLSVPIKSTGTPGPLVWQFSTIRDSWSGTVTLN
jgi:hypothetical protein